MVAVQDYESQLIRVLLCVLEETPGYRSTGDGREAWHGAGWTGDFNKVEDIEKFGEEMVEFAT